MRRVISVVATALALMAGSGTSAYAIVGGRDATSVYPGEVALSITFPGLGTGHCGGTLIAPRFVLTAAHCVSDQQSAPTPVAVPGSSITMWVGSNDRSTGGTVATGQRVYLHPDWQWGLPTGAPVSDLALVELDRDIPGVPTLPIAGLGAQVGQEVREIGWGLTSYPPTPGQDIPALLQQHDVTVVPASQCAGGGITEGEVCVTGGACLGDSGSPALHRIHNTPGWAQVGIASRETDQQHPCGAPTIYTDPTAWPFRVWIFNAVQHHTIAPCTCPPLTSTQVSPLLKLAVR